MGPDKELAVRALTMQSEGRSHQMGISTTVLAVVKVMDTINEWIGKTVSWLVIPLTLIVVYEVVRRKLFSTTTVWGYDMTIFCYGTLMMLGMGYTLLHDEHVRIDLLYKKYKPKTRAVVELILYVIFVIPVIIVFFKYGLAYASQSWAIRERVGITAWDPIVYPFKTIIPITYLLLLIQAISQVLKQVVFLAKGAKS